MEKEENNFKYVVSAPGKVILFGEHSVVYKKAAVCTSINRRLNVIVKSAKENTVSVNFPQINTSFICRLEQFVNVVKENCPLEGLGETFSLDKPELIDYNKYVQSLNNSLEYLGISSTGLQEKPRAAIVGFLFVIRGIFQNVTCKLLPFSLEVESDIEVGAGTGSSAAFAVAISGAVLNLRKHFVMNNDIFCPSPTSTVDDSVIVSSFPQKSGFSMSEAKIINKWAFFIEKLMHGRPSGIDNTTCTFGSVVVTSQQSKTGQLIFNVLESVPKISILLISTGVSRNTANLVAKVRQLRDDNRAAVDAILNAMDVIAQEAFKILETLGVNSNSSSNVDHYKTLSGLMELNHGLLRTLGVSHESLEQIVRVSSNHGLTTKLTGAGGGGYAITILPPTFSKAQIEALKNELEPTFKVSQITIAERGVSVEEL